MIMRTNLENQNSEMKKTWIKNTVRDKDIKNISKNKEKATFFSKLKSSQSKKKLITKKMADALQMKIKQHDSKNTFKKQKNSKTTEYKNNTNDKIEIIPDAPLEKETQQIILNQSNPLSSSQNNNKQMSKKKSTLRLLFLANMKDKTKNTKGEEMTDIFAKLKKIRDGTDIMDKDKIKELEFKMFLPSYTKFDLLGKGSYAEVFLCHHKGIPVISTLINQKVILWWLLRSTKDIN
jgi:hypothetical protein